MMRFDETAKLSGANLDAAMRAFVAAKGKP